MLKPYRKIALPNITGIDHKMLHSGENLRETHWSIHKLKCITINDTF